MTGHASSNRGANGDWSEHVIDDALDAFYGLENRPALARERMARALDASCNATHIRVQPDSDSQYCRRGIGCACLWPECSCSVLARGAYPEIPTPEEQFPNTNAGTYPGQAHRTVELVCTVEYKDWQIDGLARQFVRALESTISRWPEVTTKALRIDADATRNFPDSEAIVPFGVSEAEQRRMDGLDATRNRAAVLGELEQAMLGLTAAERRWLRNKLDG